MTSRFDDPAFLRPNDIAEASNARRKNVTPVPDWVLRLEFFADELHRLVDTLSHIQQDVDEAESQIDLELAATTLEAVEKRLQSTVERERRIVNEV
ncbi:MAG: hypothetical protein SGI86_09335 [Deltaproteobacteria bacterium]|nr:hypothetical protein [Deltaproteobacteria bacterium]